MYKCNKEFGRQVERSREIGDSQALSLRAKHGQACSRMVRHGLEQVRLVNHGQILSNVADLLHKVQTANIVKGGLLLCA